MPGPGRPENLLPPAKPGEVRNPRGINQYTYRAEAERHLDDWCKEYGQELVEKICTLAKQGKPWAAKLVLDRVLPTVTKIELPPTEPRSHRFIPTEDEQRELRGEFRGNGHDKSGVLQ